MQFALFVVAGLDPAIHMRSMQAWITGSSPVTTAV
jgi:hypothetical protein